jgi:hypothetical protein
MAIHLRKPIEIERGWTVDTIRHGELDSLQILDPDEKALIEKGEPYKQHLLTIGLLIFSLAFCALVFQAGWKEVLAYEKCGGKANCQAFASSPRAP